MQSESTDALPGIFQANIQETKLFLEDCVQNPEQHSLDELTSFIGTMWEDAALIAMNMIDYKASFEVTHHYITWGAHTFKEDQMRERTSEFTKKRYSATTAKIFKGYVDRLPEPEKHIDRFRSTPHTSLFVDACKDLAMQLCYLPTHWG